MSNKELIRLVFTSYRNSIDMDGMKVSLDRHAPKLCSYPSLNYLTIPVVKGLTTDNMERICNAVLDNNWNLIRDFINEMYNLGFRQLVFCDWCTKEQIINGKFCSAGIVGRYIDRNREFEFPIEVKYEDGRDAL